MSYVKSQRESKEVGRLENEIDDAFSRNTEVVEELNKLFQFVFVDELDRKEIGAKVNCWSRHAN